MANPDHLSILQQGVSAWNEWRKEHREIHPDLRGADLHHAHLREADLRSVDLREANLQGADLSGSLLTFADLDGADLRQADLGYQEVERDDYTHVIAGASLWFAQLRHANLQQARFHRAVLQGADLSEADLSEADLSEADLQQVNFQKARLRGANLYRAALFAADLREADAQGAQLQEANLECAWLYKANMTGCNVNGIQAASAYRDDTFQFEGSLSLFYMSLMVDDLEMAQFISLVLDLPTMWKAIRLLQTKLVLLVGAYTGEQGRVLALLRAELRQRDYIPVICDIQKKHDQPFLTGFAKLLHLARFVILDMTGDENLVREVNSMATISPSIPVQPFVQLSASHNQEVSGEHLSPSFLPPYSYTDASEVQKAFRDLLLERLERQVQTLLETAATPPGEEKNEDV